MLAIGCTPLAHAGTMYRCIGDDGVAAYVNQRVEGASCSVVSHYDSDTPRRPEIRDPAGHSQANVGTQAVSTADAHRASAGLNPDNVYQSNAADPANASARSPDTVRSGHVEDFGDPNGISVAAKIREPGSGFRYVQIGDSHTAGDYLTDQLRVRLQTQLGDGGAGWAMPMRVPGQRLARVSYDFNGWELISSRTSGPADYPFGGLIAQVVGDDATLSIKSKLGNPLQTITAIIRQGPHDAPLVISDVDGKQQLLASPIADGQWHSIGFSARLPVNVVARHSPETAIGGWWLSSSQTGAIVSAVGINGSEQSQWSRWRSDWMQDLEPGQPDVIALAYGTNEAFSKSLDQNLVRDDLESAIDQLRHRFPRAAILILGAPESLTAQGGSCGVRAPGLDAVQRIQKEVASNRKTLYWDWQQAMGGTCSMKRWIREGLGRGDGVHFSAAGYAQLGDDLYQGLDGLARRLSGNDHASQGRQTPMAPPQAPSSLAGH
jgi:lysophospholipase L1-like esterase